MKTTMAKIKEHSGEYGYYNTFKTLEKMMRDNGGIWPVPPETEIDILDVLEKTGNDAAFYLLRCFKTEQYREVMLRIAESVLEPWERSQNNNSIRELISHTREAIQNDEPLASLLPERVECIEFIISRRDTTNHGPAPHEEAALVAIDAVGENIDALLRVPVSAMNTKGRLFDGLTGDRTRGIVSQEKMNYYLFLKFLLETK